ncbi:MAG: methylated-DNA--[protein]-cysteine S-methyltransferase [Parachlamydia sp.]|jgi:methylated-DNA-[protein]-cysteine S-methyltransferase|nr:methylated-DNA--[protein]-cysteine S-methyltransferase [Parachlamydia sp.]
MSQQLKLLQKQSRPGPAFITNVYFCQGSIYKTTLETTIDGAFTWQLWSDQEDRSLQAKLDGWFTAYLKGERFEKEMPYSLDALPPFMRRVLCIIDEIPFGKTLSYKEIALLAGSPLAARAIGNCCKKNPVPLLIPCHRVLGTQGIGGYSGGNGIESKMALLNFETERVSDNSMVITKNENMEILTAILRQ